MQPAERAIRGARPVCCRQAHRLGSMAHGNRPILGFHPRRRFAGRRVSQPRTTQRQRAHQASRLSISRESAIRESSNLTSCSRRELVASQEKSSQFAREKGSREGLHLGNMIPYVILFS